MKYHCFYFCHIKLKPTSVLHCSCTRILIAPFLILFFVVLFPFNFNFQEKRLLRNGSTSVTHLSALCAARVGKGQRESTYTTTTCSFCFPSRSQVKLIQALWWSRWKKKRTATRGWMTPLSQPLLPRQQHPLHAKSRVQRETSTTLRLK